jgi:hypothetical protein
MSEPSSTAPEALPTLEDLLDTVAEPVQHTAQDLQALEADMLAGRIRTLIKQAMAEDEVTVRALAQRLEVSPSVISRRLSSDGDLKVWTAAALAHALGRVFEVGLRKVAPTAQSNSRPAASSDPRRTTPLAGGAFGTTARTVTTTTTPQRAPRLGATKGASNLELQTA